MADELDPIYDDEPTRGPDRKVALLILGGMGLMALTLVIIQARMKRPQPTTLGAIPDGFSWEASLKHVCDTFDMRLAGIDQRLDALANERVAQRAAAYSDIPEPLAETNGAMVERIPPVIETGPVSDVPAPAATSLPPE